MLDLCEDLDFSFDILELMRVLETAFIVDFNRDLAIGSSIDGEVNHCVGTRSDFLDDSERIDGERTRFQS